MTNPSYPLSLPSTPNFSQSTFEMVRKTGYTESPFTGKQQVHEYPYALWRATLTLPPIRRSDWNNWAVFVLQMRGRRGTFLLGDPDYTFSGTATASSGNAIQTFSPRSAGQTTLPVDGMTSGGTVNKGDYVQVGDDGSNHLYLVTNNNTVSGSGTVLLQIEPSLRVDVAVNTNVKFAGAKGIFRMDADAYGWEANAVSTYGFTFSCTQAF